MTPRNKETKLTGVSNETLSYAYSVFGREVNPSTTPLVSVTQKPVHTFTTMCITCHYMYMHICMYKMHMYVAGFRHVASACQ